MKKQTKIAGLFISFCLLAVMLAGCGSSSKSAPYENSSVAEAPAAYDSGGVYSNYTYDGEAAAPEEAAGGEGGSVEVDNSAAHGRKLIKNVDMTVETEDYSTLVAAVQDKVKALNGYIEQFNSYNENSIGRRSANLTLRIPAENLEAFVSRVNEISNIVSRQESIDDVTLQYVDLESHKKMLEEEQKRLLELMEKAETMEDIITIESRLTEVRYQLESMEAQLRTMDNQVNYSTVYLYINEVTRLTPPEEKGTWERIRIGFSENMYHVGHGLKEFCIGFIISLPVLFVFAIIIVVAVIIIKIILRFNRKREEENRKKYGVPYKPTGRPPYGPGPGFVPQGVPRGPMQGAGQNPGADRMPAGNGALNAEPAGKTNAAEPGVPDAGKKQEEKEPENKEPQKTEEKQ